MDNNKQIAVVTGASGFVGSHLVDLLLERGFHVRCIIRKSSNLKWLKNKQVEIIDCGLFDIEKLSEAFSGVSYIYHVAGVVKSKTVDGYYKGNVEATKCILEAALKQKASIKRVLVVSSQTAAGPSSSERMTTEKEICEPITNYGKSKLAQEKLVAGYFDRLPITICRPPAVYGERDTEIFIFFNTYAKGITTTIGFDRKLISLIHVKDLVEGLFLAATSEKSVGETYFITSEQVYTWDEIIHITSLALGKKALRFKIPHFVVYCIAAIAQFVAMFQSAAATLNIEKARDITRHAWICSPQKAKEHLGYKQKISLDKGIAMTLRWYKDEGWIK